VAVMVVPRLPVGGRVQPLLTVVSVTSSRKSGRGLAGLQVLLPQPAGQVMVAVRLRALPGALSTCRRWGRLAGARGSGHAGCGKVAGTEEIPMAVSFQPVIDCADPEPLARFWAAALGIRA
jgi:hypothetical protein